MLRRIIWKLFRIVILPLAGQKKHQVLFEIIHGMSLKGMNVGCDTNPEDSGEKNALEYINARLKPEKELVIFDVGANIGKYSLLLKEVFGQKASIAAFEPSGKTFQQLESNTKSIANIKLYNIGLGDVNEMATLYSNAEASGLASVYKRKLNHFNVDMNMKEEIKIQTLDDFCRQATIKHIHLLKLDVEGHEIKVLAGAANMINTGNIDFIQFEFGGTNIDSRTYFQDFYYLLKDRYIIYRIVKDGLFEIKGYDEAHEFFTTTNYMAQKK